MNPEAIILMQHLGRALARWGEMTTEELSEAMRLSRIRHSATSLMEARRRMSGLKLIETIYLPEGNKRYRLTEEGKRSYAT